MKKPVPCPCDSCTRYYTCNNDDVCLDWITWLFSPESESKYRQETLK